MSDDVDRRVSELEHRLDAMSRWIEQLEDENAALRDRIGDLEELVDPDPGRTAYDQLTKSQKVHRVRKALVERAAQTQDGTARMQYDDVQWLFDGHPSPGHAYDLMERAAELDGFGYDRPSGAGGQYRVRVNLAAVNDDALIHAANKATNEEAV